MLLSSVQDPCFQMQARRCRFLHFFLKIICIMQNFKQNANIPNVNVPKHSTDAMSPKYNSSLLPLILYFILSFLSQCISVPCPKPCFIHFILLISNCHQFLLIVIHKYTLLMSSSHSPQHQCVSLSIHYLSLKLFDIPGLNLSHPSILSFAFLPGIPFEKLILHFSV